MKLSGKLFIALLLVSEIHAPRTFLKFGVEAVTYYVSIYGISFALAIGLITIAVDIILDRKPAKSE